MALMIHLSNTACMCIVFCVSIQESADKPTRRENPHKYLLYKPTFSQLYTFLAASFKVYYDPVRFTLWGKCALSGI